MPHHQPMRVYADDTDLMTLGTAELLIVATARLWGAAGRGPAADWRRGFAAAGLDEDDAQGFGGLLRILSVAADSGFRPGCLSCRRLAPDEATLLRLVSLMQHARREPSRALLAAWLPPAAVRHAGARAAGFAAALAAAGLVVPLRHVEAAALPQLAVYAHATPGLALVQ